MLYLFTTHRIDEEDEKHYDEHPCEQSHDFLARK